MLRAAHYKPEAVDLPTASKSPPKHRPGGILDLALTAADKYALSLLPAALKGTALTVSDGVPAADYRAAHHHPTNGIPPPFKVQRGPGNPMLQAMPAPLQGPAPQQPPGDPRLATSWDASLKEILAALEPDNRTLKPAKLRDHKYPNQNHGIPPTGATVGPSGRRELDDAFMSLPGGTRRAKGTMPSYTASPLKALSRQSRRPEVQGVDVQYDLVPSVKLAWVNPGTGAYSTTGFGGSPKKYTSQLVGRVSPHYSGITTQQAQVGQEMLHLPDIVASNGYSQQTGHTQMHASHAGPRGPPGFPTWPHTAGFMTPSNQNAHPRRALPYVSANAPSLAKPLTVQYHPVLRSASGVNAAIQASSPRAPTAPAADAGISPRQAPDEAYSGASAGPGDMPSPGYIVLVSTPQRLPQTPPEVAAEVARLRHAQELDGVIRGIRSDLLQVAPNRTEPPPKSKFLQMYEDPNRPLAKLNPKQLLGEMMPPGQARRKDAHQSAGASAPKQQGGAVSQSPLPSPGNSASANRSPMYDRRLKPLPGTPPRDSTGQQWDPTSSSLEAGQPAEQPPLQNVHLRLPDSLDAEDNQAAAKPPTQAEEAAAASSGRSTPLSSLLGHEDTTAVEPELQPGTGSGAEVCAPVEAAAAEQQPVKLPAEVPEAASGAAADGVAVPVSMEPLPQATDCATGDIITAQDVQCSTDGGQQEVVQQAAQADIGPAAAEPCTLQEAEQQDVQAQAPDKAPADVAGSEQVSTEAVQGQQSDVLGAGLEGADQSTSVDTCRAADTDAAGATDSETMPAGEAAGACSTAGEVAARDPELAGKLQPASAPEEVAVTAEGASDRGLEAVEAAASSSERLQSTPAADPAAAEMEATAPTTLQEPVVSEPSSDPAAAIALEPAATAAGSDEAGPEQAVEPAPGQAGEPAPEQAVQHAPEAADEAGPGPAVEAGPEQAEVPGPESTDAPKPELQPGTDATAAVGSAAATNSVQADVGAEDQPAGEALPSGADIAADAEQARAEEAVAATTDAASEAVVGPSVDEAPLAASAEAEADVAGLPATDADAAALPDDGNAVLAESSGVPLAAEDAAAAPAGSAYTLPPGLTPEVADAAVVRIQTHARGHLARRRVAELRKSRDAALAEAAPTVFLVAAEGEEPYSLPPGVTPEMARTAVIHIQSHARGFLARRQVAELRKGREAALAEAAPAVSLVAAEGEEPYSLPPGVTPEMARTAIIRIQSHARGFLARRQVAELRKGREAGQAALAAAVSAATSSQSTAYGLPPGMTPEMAEAAAVRIQSHARGYFARRRVAALRKGQRFVEQMPAVEQAVSAAATGGYELPPGVTPEAAETAVIHIQSHMRGHLARRRVRQLRADKLAQALEAGGADAEPEALADVDTSLREAEAADAAAAPTEEAPQPATEPEVELLQELTIDALKAALEDDEDDDVTAAATEAAATEAAGETVPLQEPEQEVAPPLDLSDPAAVAAAAAAAAAAAKAAARELGNAPYGSDAVADTTAAVDQAAAEASMARLAASSARTSAMFQGAGAEMRYSDDEASALELMDNLDGLLQGDDEAAAAAAAVAAATAPADGEMVSISADGVSEPQALGTSSGAAPVNPMDLQEPGGVRVLAGKYEVQHVVGEGAYGMVMKCKIRGTDPVQWVAIKEFKIDDNDPDAEDVKRTSLREVAVLEALSHPHVVSFVDKFMVGDRLFIVMEFLPCNLLELLEAQPGGMDRDAVRLIMFQLCSAIAFIHSKGMVYRDIKPENLLVDEHGTVKLCDFGFARYLPSGPNPHLTDYVATRWYRAPELLLGPPYRDSTGKHIQYMYGPQVDMWAVGCLMGELLDGEPLFAGDSDLDQLYRVQQILGPMAPSHQYLFYANPHNTGIVFNIKQPLTLAARYRGKVSDVELDFMSGLLEMDPEKRFTGEQCLQHPYLSDLAAAAQTLPTPSESATATPTATVTDYAEPESRLPQVAPANAAPAERGASWRGSGTPSSRGLMVAESFTRAAGSLTGRMSSLGRGRVSPSPQPQLSGEPGYVRASSVLRAHESGEVVIVEGVVEVDDDRAQGLEAVKSISALADMASAEEEITPRQR
ncbi:hypothetical protein Agub_g2079 [Astrephomene gubernaculifera]|uniref:Protein kinase domain-containing protein n=1 Tax=Astrephomene gubernaculifera TaxID=47775 RepID=A0AAD3DGK4_9CHLO|nr:hypothetical protein Agub_g2079 [Astrephomene gubernaculifera]